MRRTDNVGGAIIRATMLARRSELLPTEVKDGISLIHGVTGALPSLGVLAPHPLLT